MRKLYALAFSILFLAMQFSTASAKYDYVDSIQVGKQPFYLSGDLWGFTVYCLGWDANYDGVFDEATDELPSIWKTVALYPVGKVSSETQGSFFAQTEKLTDLPFGNPGFPRRPCIVNDVFYYYQNKHIRSLNMKTLQQDSIPFDNDVYALNIQNNKLYVSARVIPDGAWVPTENYVVVLDLASKQALDTIPALMNVQMTKLLDNNKILILNEGLGSGDDSFLSLVSLEKNEAGQHETIKQFSAGSFGNYFDIDANKENVYIVSNGSHKVMKYSLFNDDSLSFEIPTSGYDGPRELVFDEMGKTMRVSAYNGKIYEYDLLSGELVDSLNAISKVESMLWTSEFLVATNISNFDYSPNDYISVWHYKYDSVNDDIAIANVYPNPTRDILNIQFEDSSVLFDNASIYDALGNHIANVNLEQSSDAYRIDISKANLSNGRYIAILSGISGKKHIPFIVGK